MTEYSTTIARVASRNAALKALIRAGWPWTIYAADYFRIAVDKAQELASVTPDLSEELRAARERITQLELLLQGDKEERRINVPQGVANYAIIVQPRPSTPVNGGRNHALLLVHAAHTLEIRLPKGMLFEDGQPVTTFEKLFDFVTQMCEVKVISKDERASDIIPIGRWLRPASSDPNTTVGGFLRSVEMMMFQIPAIHRPVQVSITVHLKMYRLRVSPEALSSGDLTITFTPFVFTS